MMSTNTNNRRKNNQNNKIYVGNIPSTIDEDDLKRIFGNTKFGKVMDVYLKESGLKENQNRYAFITYKNHRSAEKAVSQLNLKKIDGVPIRVSMARNDIRQIIGSKCGNIAVRNISPDADLKEINEYFSQFGEIDKFVLTDNSTVAFIQYRGQKRANHAIRKGNHKSFNGRKLKVSSANSPNILIKSGIPNEVINKDLFNSWIKNKITDQDDEEDEEYSEDVRFKDVRKSVLLYLPSQKKVKQGMLMFYDDKSRKEFMEKLLEKGVDCECLTEDEKHLKLMNFDREWKKGADNCVFVKNIPNSLNHKDINKLFCEMDGFKNCQFIDQQYRTIAYVYFNSKKDQHNAIRKSIMISLPDEHSKYPKQLNASLFVDNREKHESIENEYQEKIENKLRKRIIKDFGDSVQLNIFGQFSFDQINELYRDKKLFDAWAKRCDDLLEEAKSINDDFDDSEKENGETKKKTDDDDFEKEGEISDDENDDDDYDYDDKIDDIDYDDNIDDIDYDDNDEI